MAHLQLSHVSVDFPIFSSQARGLVNSILRFDRALQQRIESKGGAGVTVHALRDIDIHLRTGDRVALIGRNGAGKTTLLRVMSGIYEPEQGEILSSGKLTALTDLMLGVDPEASGYDFVITRGIVMGLTRAQAKGLFSDVEEFTELGDYLYLPVRSYSTGMLLRLAFAVSTAIVPDILLMDEMIGVGDSRFLERAHRRLGKLMSQVEIMVLASHNEEILRAFCTKGIVMTEGRVVHQGSLEECLELHNASDPMAASASAV
ncbi:ABC transporter ATP-binding protein [Acidovorax sp. SUPP3434]|uniref:ABC transporter ATP-binding protein n=1 Tax=Acidovorax sp. SUPP3434 TaxID=2920880 RepID=UPI0023DE5C03|nr:ATP-binding cassette domain-containing protein [Acidovorax sp. SUPP3434]GKS98845.1 ABC transporter ATP-binding protein [Acidovorax sp. SUPP3434]